jgi:hypothetical protein
MVQVPTEMAPVGTIGTIGTIGTWTAGLDRNDTLTPLTVSVGKRGRAASPQYRTIAVLYAPATTAATALKNPFF